MPHAVYACTFAGSTIASALALPELPPAPEAAAPHFRIDVTANALLPSGDGDSRHDWVDAAGTVNLTGIRCGDTHYLHLPGLADACLRADGRVTVRRDPAASVTSLRHAVVDQVLPRLLAGDGALMAHAAAVVASDARALVLLGETGYGKSTLCAALVGCGARLLTDDCARLDAVDERVRVTPGYPGIRLRPDSLAALYDHTPDTTAVADHMDKRRITLGAPGTPRDTVVDAAVTLRSEASAMVVLQPPGRHARIRIEKLTVADACMAIVHNSFALDPMDIAWVRGQLARAAAVARAVPVYRLGYPRDYARLPQVMARLRGLPRQE